VAVVLATGVTPLNGMLTLRTPTPTPVRRNETSASVKAGE
jgi:hypothetical protein